MLGKCCPRLTSAQGKSGPERENRRAPRPETLYTPATGTRPQRLWPWRPRGRTIHVLPVLDPDQRQPLPDEMFFDRPTVTGEEIVVSRIIPHSIRRARFDADRTTGHCSKSFLRQGCAVGGLVHHVGTLHLDIANRSLYRIGVDYFDYINRFAFGTQHRVRRGR